MQTNNTTEIEISKTTIQRIEKDAKTIRREQEKRKLNKAKDEAAQNKGFASFNDARSKFEQWNKLPIIYILFSKNEKLNRYVEVYEDKEKTKFIPSKHKDENINISELEKVTESKIKLVVDDILINKLCSKVKHINDIDYYFFEFTSYKLDLEKEREQYKEDMKKDSQLYKESWFISDKTYKLDNYLMSKLKIEKEKEIIHYNISPSYFIIENQVFNANGLHDEEYSDHVMNHDFYN